LNKAKIGVYIILIPIYGISSLVVFFTLKKYESFYLENLNTFRMILFMRGFLRILTDIYIYANFIKYFFFFVNRKIQTD
jgi:hypothetical protein